MYNYTYVSSRAGCIAFGLGVKFKYNVCAAGGNRTMQQVCNYSKVKKWITYYCISY